MASTTDILSILKTLSIAFPHFKPDEDTPSVYYMLLKDIPGDLLRMAAVECATHSKFFPTVYELRQAVINLDKRANAVPSSAEAWQEVLKAPKNMIVTRSYQDESGGWHIENRRYVFSHPLVETVARLMGWPDRFLLDVDDIISDRARFLQAYEAKLQTSTAEALSLPAVREYIDGQLEAGQAVKQLAKGMSR
jgi:hypothetical protein